MNPAFRPGARVRVLKGFPPGHCRTPYYCRGHEGTVERVCITSPQAHVIVVG